MRIINKMIIPEFVKREGKLIPYDKLDKETQRFVRSHGQHESVLNNRRYFRRILKNTYTVMKEKGSFSSDEYLETVGAAKKKGWIPQWNIKRAHGGGQGASSCGKIDFGKTQVIKDVLKELDILDDFMKLPIEKRTNRIQKIIGEIHDFKTEPRVKIGKAAVDYDGIIWGRPGWMKRNGVGIGAKTTLATKGLIVPLPALECTNIDLLVNDEENKLNLSEEKLGKCIKWIPRLSPGFLFNRNLKRKFSKVIGRNPKAKWDLLTLLNKVPNVDLTHEKEIYEKGSVTEDDVKSMFGYESGGEIKIRPVGKRILAGESIFHPDIWPEVEKPLVKMIFTKMQPTIHGLYGVVLPKSLLRIIDNDAKYFNAFVTRYPWILPIKTTIGLWNDILFVRDDLWKAFGGDFDGDQGVAFDVRSIDTGLDWDKDNDWLKRIMKMPDKKPGTFEGDEDQVIAKQLDQYSACGRVYNNGKVVVDAARMEGLGYRELVELDTKIAANDVQPFIDGFKYKFAESVPDIADLCSKYCVKFSNTRKVKDYYRAIRSRNKSPLEVIVGKAQLANSKSKGFYERLVSIFKDWKKGEYVSARKISKGFEMDIKRSYVKYTSDVGKRYASIKRYLHTQEAVNATIRNCYKRRDIPFAIYLEGVTVEST